MDGGAWQATVHRIARVGPDLVLSSFNCIFNPSLLYFTLSPLGVALLANCF